VGALSLAILHESGGEFGVIGAAQLPRSALRRVIGDRLNGLADGASADDLDDKSDKDDHPDPQQWFKGEILGEVIPSVDDLVHGA